jgi:hypothetical protein
MNSTSTNQLQAQISRIKQKLCALGDMTPGALSTQYNVCGNPTCRCKDPENPQRHGPYNQLSFSRKGKSTTRFVRKEELKEVKKQVENYAKFKALVDEWIEISLKLADFKRQENRRIS